jgi:FkbM family methyltransferase
MGKNSKKPTKKQTICLNMIVKNEAHIIKECLEQVAPLIDYYVINDTGSTDGTQKIIKDFFGGRGIKGEIIEHEFRTCKCHGGDYKKYDFFHFGWNRSFALDRCRGKSDYIFIMDADDTIEGTLKFPPKLEADQYYMNVKTDFNHYFKPLLIKNDPKLKWRWECGLHEYLAGDVKLTYKLMGDYAVISRRLGARNQDPLKYYKDARVLEVLMKDHPDEVRYKYYYAQSWFDAREYDKAISTYKQVIDECEQSDPDRAYTCYYMIGRSHILKNSSVEDIEAAFVECHKKFKHRAEPIYQLCTLFCSRGDYKKAYDYGVKGIGLSPEIQTVFYVDRSIYEYKLLDELVYCASELGFHREALKWSEKILRDEKYPKESYEPLITNIHILKQIVGQETIKKQQAIIIDHHKPNLCFYIGPSPIHQKTKFGSELAVLYLAKELTETHNVFIMGDECKLEQNDDDGIIYLPTKFDIAQLSSPNGSISRFDVMIVSRYIHYFLENDVMGISKKTFVWLHDVEFHPYWNKSHICTKSIVPNIDHVVDGYIVLSPWHKKYILANYKISRSKIHIIGNGISNECRDMLKKKSVKKVLNKFIWVSAHDRGLSELVVNFHKIIHKIPDAHLDIYRELPEDLQEYCKKYDFIHMKGQCSNEEILDAFSKADYWFYPTAWNETFCISALEAQAMGCVCISSDLAALNTTVGEYGILLKSKIHSEDFWREGVAAIEKCNKDGDFKKNLVQKSKGRAWNFTWDKVVSSWLMLFEDTTSPTPTSSKIQRQGYDWMNERLCVLRDVFGFSPKNALDIGANVGQWNKKFRQIFPHCRVLSIEANSACISELARNKIEYVNVLLSSKDDETQEFYMCKENTPTGASMFREKTDFYRDTNIHIKHLPTKRLDTILNKDCLDKNIQHLDFIKIDVQGAELEVLRGATNTLRNTDFVCLEISLMRYNEKAPLLADVVSFMDQHDFALYDFMEFHYINESCVQIDGLFLHKKSRWNKMIASVHKNTSFWKVDDLFQED